MWRIKCSADNYNYVYVYAYHYDHCRSTGRGPPHVFSKCAQSCVDFHRGRDLIAHNGCEVDE